MLTRFNTWSNALDKAGLEQTSFKIINDIDLFNEIERVWVLKGKQPTATDVKMVCLSIHLIPIAEDLVVGEMH